MVYVGYFLRGFMEGKFSCRSAARATHSAAIGPVLGLSYSVVDELERDLHGVSALAPKKCTGIRRVNGTPVWINPVFDPDPDGYDQEDDRSTKEDRRPRNPTDE
jgi:hypothetical protein